MTKVSFLVEYTPPIIAQIGDVMSRLDLGITRISLPVTEVISWKTNTPVDEEYLVMMKANIKKILQEQGAADVVVKNYKETPELLSTNKE